MWKCQQGEVGALFSEHLTVDIEDALDGRHHAYGTAISLYPADLMDHRYHHVLDPCFSLHFK
jgi:hypothetical protein